MTIIGPGDAKHYRTTVDRKRWYHDPLPSDDKWEATEQLFPSVSKVKQAKGFDAAEYVAMKECAADVAANPQKYAGLDFDDTYAMFKSVRARKAAAKRGTAVHNYAEALVKGDTPFTLGEPEEYTRYIPVIEDFLAAWQPELVAVETVFYNRTLGYAGTGDIILRFGDKIYMADWKSRDDEPKAYPDDAAQIGAYGKAEYMVVLDDDGNPKRSTLPELDGGIVVSIAPDNYQVFPVDLDEAYVDFERLYRWHLDKAEYGKRSIGNPWPPRASAIPLDSAIKRAASKGKLIQLYKERRSEWTDVHTRIAAARKRELAG